jgi:sec-independent protein translocase protein TatA
VLSGIGTTELVLIGVVLFFLFGGKKLPELARGVGDSIREFRNTVKE